MYFKRIEMHGFKSFAEPVVIEFHEGVTCIVGPNGSGKSNISDAIRWVLGEQSPKMLRGGKMEEVIFAGTASRKSRGMAEVTLVIDNSSGLLDIDYNEVAITRRMYRSGESEYMINNNQCRLRDIKELIMDTGIGVDGYSIIGQGKIADIVSNKPESRREIFEEAAGVVMYKSRKNEAERKLESTTGNLDRANDIIGEIEGRIDGLREDSEKAKEYLKLRERYQELEINITLKNVEKLEQSNQAIAEDVKNLTVSVEELSIKKKQLDEELLAGRQKSENLEQLGTEARDNLLTKTQELNNLTNRSQLDDEKINTIKRDSQRLEKEIDDLDQRLDRELESIAVLQEKQEEVAGNLREEEANLQEKIQAYNNVTAQILELSGKTEDARNEMYRLHNESSSAKSEARSMESYRESLEKRRQQILSEGEESEHNTKEYQKNRETEYRIKKENTEKAERLKQEIFQAKQQVSSLQHEISIISKSNDDARIKGSQLSARKKTIEEMEHNYEGYNGAVRFVMKAGITGIEGVVGDLMEAPAGYETALETALGGALQNIVCRKDQDAKKAIAALKNNKAGRLTFLPMESVRGNKASVSETIKTHEGFKGMGCDLAKYDEKYRGVFQYLLGRVVVVDHMDSAIQLSKIAGNGIRFVTLEGEIINAGGAITGGKYKNATANLLARKSEISQLAAQVEELRKQFEEGRNRADEKNQACKKLQADITAMEEEIRQAQFAVSESATKIAAMDESFKNISQSMNRREHELEAIAKDIENVENVIRSTMESSEEAEKQVQQLEAEIASDTEKLNQMRTKGEEASESITNARIARQDWDNRYQSGQDMLLRVKNTASDYRNQIDERKNRLQEMEREKNSILFRSEDSEELFERCSSEKKQLEDYIARVAEERTQLNTVLHEKTQEWSALGEKLNAYQDQKYQQEIKMAKNETQLDTFKEKLWDEFEISYAQALQHKQQDFVLSTASRESREVKARIRQLGDVNIGSIKEYEQVSERYKFLTEQRADILEAMQELQTIIADMDRTIKTRFKENFDQVVINFESIFKELFGGGQAELRLDDEENPLESGIEIVAQPPGKKLQNINLMSGGEKTMTAIALMFAVLKTKPTPFCILDEVEAALDDSNIERFANYLRKFENIQFAVVTHQKTTMEHADVLYGVTMPEQGISKVLSLRLGDNFDL